MDGVTYVLLTSPEMEVPPETTVYQRYWPLVPPMAVSMTAPGPQELPAVATGEIGTGVMIALTAVRLLSQIPLLMATK